MNLGPSEAVSVRRRREEVYMGWREQLQIFNFQHENVKFLVEILDRNHPKLLEMTEILILTISTHRVILSGEMFFS